MFNTVKILRSTEHFEWVDCILNTHVWGRKRQKKGGKLEGKEEGRKK